MADLDAGLRGYEPDFDRDDYAEDDRCGECDAFGDYQCSKHGDAVIAMQRAEHEHHATVEALQTLLACPDALDTPTGRQLRALARGALTELGVES